MLCLVLVSSILQSSPPLDNDPSFSRDLLNISDSWSLSFPSCTALCNQTQDTSKDRTALSDKTATPDSELLVQTFSGPTLGFSSCDLVMIHGRDLCTMEESAPPPLRSRECPWEVAALVKSCNSASSLSANVPEVPSIFPHSQGSPDHVYRSRSCLCLCVPMKAVEMGLHQQQL